MAGKEIALENGDILTDDSVEIARIWVTNNAGSSVWIDAGVLQDPTIFGYLMSDTVRHAARAYAARWSLDERQALQSIVNGLSEELRRQVGELETIRPGGLV
jgi:hypothetical protein